MKFVKKDGLCTISSTWYKQTPMTYVPVGLLQQHKDFQSPHK